MENINIKTIADEISKKLVKNESKPNENFDTWFTEVENNAFLNNLKNKSYSEIIKDKEISTVVYGSNVEKVREIGKKTTRRTSNTTNVSPIPIYDGESGILNSIKGSVSNIGVGSSYISDIDRYCYGLDVAYSDKIEIPVTREINKSEEIFLNYNELADELAKRDLDLKYGKYDEIVHLNEWTELNNKYIKLILKYERAD